MDEEVADIVDRPKDARVLPTMFVHKIKRGKLENLPDSRLGSFLSAVAIHGKRGRRHSRRPCDMQHCVSSLHWRR